MLYYYMHLTILYTILIHLLYSILVIYYIDYTYTLLTIIYLYAIYEYCIAITDMTNYHNH